MKKIEIKGNITTNNDGPIYDYFGLECAYPKKLKKELEEAAGDDVVIEINSGGGVCVSGYEMYTAIKEYEGKTTAHVINAMSAATLIACAADEALMSDAGIYMIHNAQTFAQGDYRDMKMTAEALEEYNAGIINAYVRKTGKSREEIQAMMDNDTHMGPETAIENGFIDGYIFGDPDKKKEPDNFATKIVAAGTPLIPEEKIAELREYLAAAGKLPQNAKVAPVQPEEKQEETGEEAVSDKTKEGGKTIMTLAEFLAENHEAEAELKTMTDQAREEGVKAERARIQSLDVIAKTVTAEALTEAKYGENPLDGPTLAYQAMANGEKLAAAYMTAAKDDAKESGTEEVGTGTPDTGEEQTDEADEMASYVNNAKGGK